MLETRPGEDHYAIDAYVHLSKGLVPVQVKCTTKEFTVTDPHITWGITQDWWDKWCQTSAPVFVLLVRVPKMGTQWIDYSTGDATLHKTAAYWVEIDKTMSEPPPSVKLFRGQRFTTSTFAEWDSIHKKGLGLL
jgi:hypothetical protein